MSVPSGTPRTFRSDEPTGNHIVDRLGTSIRAELLEHADLVRLEPEEELFVAGERLKRIVFPISAVCSLLLGLRSGQDAGTGTIGCEGMVGICAVLDTTPTERAIVQIGGEALVVGAASFRHQLELHPSMRLLVRRHVAYNYDMAKQNGVCNAYHTIDERVPRWLLIASDRARKRDLPFTQELLSRMVAASRPRVSEVLARLRADGLLDHGRGFMRILNRKGLEGRSCECYAAMRDWEKRCI